jgi:FkbM family methyltransferase
MEEKSHNKYFEYIASKLKMLSNVSCLGWGKLYEVQRLRNYERYETTVTSLLDSPTRIVDAASFLSAYYAIFGDEVYNFESESEEPTILDGGANVGLATIYWKKKWPEANITAFEPDPYVFEALKWNCQKRDYDDVTLVQKGLWSEDTTLHFSQDGADGGHLDDTSNSIKTDSSDKGNVSVPVVRLLPFLDRPIDLLKLDIEGAEIEVLLDCEGHLDQVKRVFVEFHSYIDQEQRLDELLYVLRKSGFRILIKPELVAKQPFLNRLDNHGMDNRLNIFGYRL